jgi:Derlin-2/3
MVMAFVYSYSQINRGQRTRFFVIDIPVVALPYAMLLLTMVMGGWYSALVESMGIVAAHLYNFLTHIYPVYGGGRNFITVPAFVEKYFTRHTVNSGNRGYGTAVPPSRSSGPTESSGSTSQSSWGWASANAWKGRGAGRRLGG